MPECRHSFHGYSRSKDFLNTLKNCFESATCSLRPWTTKWSKADANGKIHNLVLSHTNKRGDVDNFRFRDILGEVGANKWGKLYLRFLPLDTFKIHPGHADGDFSEATNLGDATNYPLWYHGTELEDSDVLPNYVWYWLWVDDDAFALRVMGNVGGEGTAATASEWVYYGPAKAREDAVYEFPDPGYCILTEHNRAQERGMMYEMLDTNVNAPHYWNTQATSLVPAYSLESPVRHAVFPSLIPIMTSNTTPSGIIRESSHLYANYIHYVALYAFMQGTNTQWWYSNTAPTGWVEYEFPSATTITEYSVCGNSTYTANWVLQGSNNGTTYTDIDSRSNQFNEGDSAVRIHLSSHATYKIFRLVVTGVNAGARAGLVGFSVGTHDKPTIMHAAATPLTTSSATAIWNGRAYPGRTAFAGTNAIKYAVLPLQWNTPGYAATGDIVSIDEEGCDYYSHLTNDNYDSATGGTYYNCYIKRMESPKNVTATPQSGSIKLRWANPEKFKGIKIIRSESNHYMLRPTDGTEIFNSTSITPLSESEFVDAGLTSGKTYFYAIFAYDSAGLYSFPILSARAEAAAL